MWQWLWGRTPSSTTHQHNKNISKEVCCNDFCKHNDRYICDEQECIQKHKGHLTMSMKQYKQVNNDLQRQIKYREQIEESMRQYYSSILGYLSEIFEKQIIKLLSDIDNNFFGKDFKEIYQRHKKGDQYMSYLIDYQSGPGMQLSETIRNKVKEKEKHIPRLCKQFLSVQNVKLDERILPQNQKIRQIISVSKIEKIKAIMPFHCELIPRYTASIHKFSARTLHSKSIRGPIILVAESYKNRTFGGYSPRMFSKDQKYEEDVHCQSFLFSLDDRIRIPLKEQYRKYAIKGGDNLWFGRGDLAISNECHKANISWSELGRAYETPRAAIGQEDSWLGGAKYFRIIEYQIYQVDKQQKY